MTTPLSFNANWYLSQNPDVAAAIEAGAPFNAFEHFTLYGRAENRSASPVFDAEEYLRNNPDVAEAVAQGLITAWDHFELFGGAEGRSPTPLFNEAFYLQQNPDVAAAIEQGIISSAAQHFALFGQSEPRAINPAINLGQYINANPDIGQAAANGLINPLDHLMQYGVNEGRPLGNGVSLADFSSDPGFTQALGGGNPVQALIRVESVAPFMPTFERPAGWTPPANTPIPVDFVPPASSGIKLVVPPEVVVPDDVDLPDTFEPVTPPAPEPDTGSGGNNPVFTVIDATAAADTPTLTAGPDKFITKFGGISTPATSSTATVTADTLTDMAVISFTLGGHLITLDDASIDAASTMSDLVIAINAQLEADPNGGSAVTVAEELEGGMPTGNLVFTDTEGRDFSDEHFSLTNAGTPAVFSTAIIAADALTDLAVVNFTLGGNLIVSAP